MSATLGSVINRLLGKTGYRIVRVPPILKSAVATDHDQRKKALVEELSRTPLDASAHLKYARFCWTNGMQGLAFAELSTAAFLGADAAETDRLFQEINATIEPLEDITHNVYYRLHSLAAAIREVSGAEKLSVLDIGGGTGNLARFIPDHPYVLVEPRVNGISGEQLPFPERSFDLVVSCHVLEHIPTDQREQFLDSLLARARKGVILLNPFSMQRSLERERQQLIYSEMGLSWAKEHMDCVLPELNDVRAFAEKNGLSFAARPNATSTTTFGLIWAERHMNLAGANKSWRKVNRLLNTRMMHMMDSTEYPSAYLVILRRKTL